MKIVVKLALSIFVALASIPIKADSFHPSTAVAIKDVSFFSAKDLIYPDLAGVVLIEFDVAIPWATTPGSPSCATRIIAVDKEDKHLISALTTSKPINFAVNNDQKAREYCYARYLKVAK